MRLVVQIFLSLDGVYQGPGSPDEDRTDGFDRGGWLVPFVDRAFENKGEAWTASATAFLFGHRTYDAFGAFWPTVTDPADKNAMQLNTLPKYVAARSPIDTPWEPVTVIDGDLGDAVRHLKANGEGELQVHGSGRLARSLLELGLVDELRTATAPVVVGAGRRLFTETKAPFSFSIVEEERTPSGLLLSTFAYVGEADVGAYVRGETDKNAR